MNTNSRTVEKEHLALWTIIEIRWPLLADLLATSPQLVNYALDNSVELMHEIPAGMKSLIRKKEVVSVLKGIENPLSVEAIQHIVGFPDDFSNSKATA